MAEIDLFDRMIGSLHGLPDVVSTKASTIRAVTPMIGSSQTFIVQTFRQRESGDTIFVECAGATGYVRLALPPSVADAIARQRSSLTDQSRSKSSRETMERRMESGEVPGFMRRKKKRK